MSGDALNPTGAAQPALDQVYETSGNQATKEPAEEVQSKINENSNSRATDQRIPQTQSSSQDEATATSVARGIRGAPPGEEVNGETHESMGRNQELDGQQMGASGEGRVADAVKGENSGAGGSERGMETDLDRKKKEQAPLRAEKQEEKAASFDVSGVLGQRGGPANPVDKGNYPNSSS